MKLFSLFHDPDNLFVPLLSNFAIPAELNGSVVAVSPATTKKSKDLIEKLGFKTIKGGFYGTARLNILKHVLSKRDNDHFIICDFDKLIHWLNTNPNEFLKILKGKPMFDITFIARSARALSTYPETWVQTEQIATRVLTKIIKQNVDFMNGPCILSHEAAEIISKSAAETGVGSCVEFCLLAFQAGLSIGNLEVDGLTWEDPERYSLLIKKAKSFEDWKYDTYHSLYEWRKRVEFLHKQVDVMIRLTEEPINPKYPAVHNITFENSN